MGDTKKDLSLPDAKKAAGDAIKDAAVSTIKVEKQANGKWTVTTA